MTCALNYSQNEKRFKRGGENENIRVMFNDFSQKNPAVYEMKQKFIAETDRQVANGNIKRRMRFGCWRTEAEDTHSLLSYTFMAIFVVLTKHMNT